MAIKNQLIVVITPASSKLGLTPANRSDGRPRTPNRAAASSPNSQARGQMSCLAFMRLRNDLFDCRRDRTSVAVAQIDGQVLLKSISAIFSISAHCFQVRF